MTASTTTRSLVDAFDGGYLVTVHMYDGAITEYAEVVDIPDGEGHPRVRVQPYRPLSGGRLEKKGRTFLLTINQINYVTPHLDRQLPTEG